MSKETPAERRARIRRAFAEAARELDLELERPVSAAEEPRMVGALAPAAHSTVDVDDSSEPPASDDDRQQIQAVIEQWEKAEVDDLAATAEKVLTDPYVILKPTGDADAPTEAAIVDFDYFRQWVDSDHFEKLSSHFPSRSPREVEVSDLQIVHLGSRIASATYTTREQGREGKVFLSVGTAVLVKGADGWKITFFTKHARHE